MKKGLILTIRLKYRETLGCWNRFEKKKKKKNPNLIDKHKPKSSMYIKKTEREREREREGEHLQCTACSSSLLR